MLPNRPNLVLVTALGILLAGCGESDRATAPRPTATLAVTLTPDTLVMGDSLHLVASLSVVGTTADSIGLAWDTLHLVVPGGVLERWIAPGRTGLDSVVLTGWAAGIPAVVTVHAFLTEPLPLPPLASLLASLDSVRATLGFNHPAAGRLILLARKFTLAGQTLAQRLGTTFVYDSATQAYVASARPGAPADAIRYALYTVNSGAVTLPLVETGTADLSVEGTDTAARIRVRVIEQGDTVIDYLARGRLYGSPMTGFWVDAQGSILTSAGLLDLRVVGDLRTPAFGGYVSAGTYAAYPGARVDLFSSVLSGSHTTVGFPRSLLDVLLRPGQRDSVRMSLRWDPSTNLQYGSGEVRAGDVTLYQVDAADHVSFWTADTVASAAALATWSSLTNPWFGLPRSLNGFSSGLFEPVAFMVRSQ